MDFSFEKTNSAYMLFYEKCPISSGSSPESADCASSTIDSNDVSSSTSEMTSSTTNQSFELSKELEDWIWQDNMHFIQDKNIFEHTYFK